MRTQLLVAGIVGAIAGACLSSAANAAITLTSDPTELTRVIEHSTNSPNSVVGATFVAGTGGTPHGIGSAALGGFPTSGNEFAIMTTGNAAFADQPNTAHNTGANNGGGNVRGNTDFDVSILRIDLDVPVGANCLSLDFRFFSEEFPEYVGSQYNDAFIAELDSSTWTTSGSTITAPDNFAFDPAGQPITINAAGVTSMSAANAAGTTYDGATPLMTASTPITSGLHSLYLSIFDQGDRMYDSAVFLDRLVLGTTAPGGCQPGATVLSVTKTTSTPIAFPGQATRYEITVHNPSDVAVTLDTITDSLPAGFSYIAGSAAGISEDDPEISGDDLIWTGPFDLPANGSVALQLSATASNILGDHFNNASATASNAAVTPSGPTAVVSVQAPSCTLGEFPSIDCAETEPCDVLGSDAICPQEAAVTEESTHIELDAGELCPGSTVRVIHSSLGQFTRTAQVSGSVCGSECFNGCFQSCVGVPLQRCQQACVRRCVNGVCVEWETRCELSQLQVDCSGQCFDQCLANGDSTTGTSFFNQHCGFPVAESIEVRAANGACTGALVSVQQLQGAGTAAVNVALPLTPGDYDVCMAGSLLSTVTVRDDCGVPACNLTAANPKMILTNGQGASLSAELANLLAGGEYTFSLRRYQDDAHTVELNVPPFLSVTSPLTVAENGTAAVEITAIDPQPLGEQRHWANVMLIAHGPATCSIGIDVDIVEQCGDGVVDPGEQCDLGPRNCPAGQYCESGCTSDCRVIGLCTGSAAQCTSAADCAEGQGCCGNAVVEAGEQCDDGNLQDGDCCSSACQAEAASCAPLPSLCAGVFGPHIVSNPTLRVTMKKGRGATPGRLGRWVARGQFTLHDGQVIHPESSLVRFALTQSAGQDYSTTLYAPVLNPLACPDGVCFTPRHNRNGFGVLWKFHRRAKEQSITGAPGWRLGTLSRRPLTPSRFNLRLRGVDAEIEAPALLGGSRRVRASLKVGASCITRTLECVPNQTEARFVCKEPS